MITSIVSRIVILLFGTLYPAYASYKAIRTKDVKEYVKWMMYWIVFAFFTCIETFTDIFLSWFPFYYEIKVLVVLWLLSPATKGSSTLYRKFVHPMLTRREQEIDDYISQAKEKGYTAVLQLGSKGVNYATNVIMQTAIKVINPVNGLPASQSDPSIATASRVRGRDVPDFVYQEVARSQSMQSVLYGENQQQLYEIDSEEEVERFLRFDRDTSRPPSRNEENNFDLPLQTTEQMDVIREDENETPSDGEDGAAKTREVPKPKTRRTRAVAAAKPKPVTAAPRGRRKLRKDSDMEVEVC